MKSNSNNQHHDRHPYDRSDYKRYDDFNILAPSPDFDMFLPEDEDDELLDYTLMDNAVDLDYEE